MSIGSFNLSLSFPVFKTVNRKHHFVAFSSWSLIQVLNYVQNYKNGRHAAVFESQIMLSYLKRSTNNNL